MPAFDRPVFIIAAPRSGSTLLFELLAANRAFWTVGGESHHLIEGMAPLHPAQRNWASNRLDPSDAGDALSLKLRGHFSISLVNADHVPYRDVLGQKETTVRLLEKTPKNALRIPFLKAVFPDAKFIFLHRDARSNIASIMAAWRSGRFVTYPDLPGWTGLPWSLLLIPGWRELIGDNLAEIAMRQWRDANEIALEDLNALPKTDWCALRHEDLIENPGPSLARLCRFAGVPFDSSMEQRARPPLPHSRHTLTPPMPEKWRLHAAEIQPVLGKTEDTALKLESLGSPA